MDHMAKTFAIKSDFKPELNPQTQRTQRKKIQVSSDLHKYDMSHVHLEMCTHVCRDRDNY